MRRRRARWSADTLHETPQPVLPDVLAPGLRIVFCGTAVGAASARRQAYYAGPGNRFWETLHEVGLTPRRIDPAGYRSVLDFGIGLTDLAKRVSGADSSLEAGDFDQDGLWAKIRACRPRLLAFTGKRAAAEALGRPVGYGLVREADPAALGAGNASTQLFVLPSPSGAARRYWSLEPWQELARLVGH